MQLTTVPPQLLTATDAARRRGPGRETGGRGPARVRKTYQQRNLWKACRFGAFSSKAALATSTVSGVVARTLTLTLTLPADGCSRSESLHIGLNKLNMRPQAASTRHELGVHNLGWWTINFALELAAEAMPLNVHGTPAHARSLGELLRIQSKKSRTCGWTWKKLTRG